MDMFTAILGNTKQAEVEFRDQEKYRSLPGLALPAICFLDEYLTKDMRVLEWGSGASTIFFAMRCAVTAVEHSEEWFETVVAALRYRDNRHIPYRVLRKPNDGFDPEFMSHQPGYESVNFRDYVEGIWDATNECYDVILVDGRARCACLKAAPGKLKKGGLLILDDSQRPQYHRAMAEIDWPVMHFEGCIPYYKHGRTVRTTIWVKE